MKAAASFDSNAAKSAVKRPAFASAGNHASAAEGHVGNPVPFAS